MPSKSLHLAAVEVFKGLSPSILSRIESELEPVVVAAGTVLVREGDEADALYIVVAGRFSVEVGDTLHPVAEIANGATIGEIAFFSGSRRTATCRALRDSVVLCLTRGDFDAILRDVPAIWANITATLAQRLALETRKRAALQGGPPTRPRPRTLAIVPAGPQPLDPDVLHKLVAARARAQTAILHSANMGEWLGRSTQADDGETARKLNALEDRFQTLIYIADATLTHWSKLAIRQADEVLLVGRHDEATTSAPVALNALEAFSMAQDGRHTQNRHRLILVHASHGRVNGTRQWLVNRPITMHHHVTLDDANALARVWRFVEGEALGFVACGGGAYCAAHIGLYKAFQEAGTSFDCLGGTSGGAAMSAAFAEGLEADAISERVHATFIVGKAMRRYTLPRYGLLDHTHFDTHMKALYGDRRIEDLWTPYFAVALDLTTIEVKVIQSGPVWSAVRASAAIPGLLPPFIDERGHLLVDGSVAANVPIDIMHRIKRGPNIVVTFALPHGEESAVAYDALPGRRQMLMSLLNPWARGSLPAIPSAGSILVRTLMANRNHFEQHLTQTDRLLMPPLPSDLGVLDWGRHKEVAAIGYRYAQKVLSEQT